MTPRQIDEARDEARDALAAARHPETGDPLFPTIFALADETGRDPGELGDPDLVALPDRRHWVRTKLTGERAWVADDPSLPGMHRPEGVVALAGSGFGPARPIDADLRDVAPSVLAMLGLPIPGHIQGVPFAGLDGRATRSDAASGIPSRHAPAPGSPLSPEDEAIVEQRLIDLGYLG